MKFDLPQIYWHGNSERVMSVDFLSHEGVFITAGADLEFGVYMRVWQLSFSSTTVTPQHVEDLIGTHERPVNVVRVAPSHTLIASGSDDCCVVIWGKKLKPVFGQDAVQVGWGSVSVLRGHTREVNDLCWSADSRSVATASMDGSCIIFDVVAGRIQQRLEGNVHSLQGVAWHYNCLVTLSSDRVMRVYKKGKKSWFIKHSVRDFNSQALFQNAYSASAYFRRLAISPDGQLLLTPAGKFAGEAVLHCFFMRNYTEPVLSYPVNLTEEVKPTVIGVRVCPVIFKAGVSAAISGLSYKLVWAAITRESVIVYNNEQLTPVSSASNLHFSTLCDLAWCRDKALAVCSNDGYISFLLFEDRELGEPVGSFEQHSFVPTAPAPTPVTEIQGKKLVSNRSK